MYVHGHWVEKIWYLKHAEEPCIVQIALASLEFAHEELHRGTTLLRAAAVIVRRDLCFCCQKLPLRRLAHDRCVLYSPQVFHWWGVCVFPSKSEGGASAAFDAHFSKAHGHGSCLLS